MNEDLKVISKTSALIEKSSISIRFVASDVYPIYPEFCDVINAWCFSGMTPRCPEALYRDLDFRLSNVPENH